MALTATIKGWGATATALGVIGGSAIGLDHMHVSQGDFNTHMEADRVQTILTLVEQSRAEGSPAWMCRIIEAEFIELCTRNPDHYLCNDPDAKRELTAKAGC